MVKTEIAKGQIALNFQNLNLKKEQKILCYEKLNINRYFK